MLRSRDPKFAILAGALASTTLPPIPPASAQDASFGCKVLLCAAASNPSWRGISYCVPVMTQLFAMLRRKGASWPVCGEANVGAPQHEPFADCPEATQAVALTDDRPVADPHGPWCKRLERNASERSDRGNAAVSLIPRERRAEPWYVVLDGPQGPQRFYFSLGQ
jgi:hypothetical protein